MKPRTELALTNGRHSHSRVCCLSSDEGSSSAACYYSPGSSEGNWAHHREEEGGWGSSPKETSQRNPRCFLVCESLPHSFFHSFSSINASATKQNLSSGGLRSYLWLPRHKQTVPVLGLLCEPAHTWSSGRADRCEGRRQGRDQFLSSSPYRPGHSKDSRWLGSLHLPPQLPGPQATRQGNMELKLKKILGRWREGCQPSLFSHILLLNHI